MKIRPTGILIENNKILLLDQTVNSNRKWSLPGGSLKNEETLEECLIRETREETGLEVKIIKLLYVNDFFRNGIYVLHITFLIKRISGSLGKTTDTDEEEIRDVKMIPIDNLKKLGFDSIFVKLVKNNFPESGSYKGSKSNIGL